MREIPHWDLSLRFTDVVGELHRIASLARRHGEAASEIADACSRAESLLARLRNEFVDGLTEGPAGDQTGL